ncbi:CLUMA_CG017420, isoform A [Clunio marinus]|uniref:CLUMA_CG017420, isoform A n=1 Tax=Clunio marinus TaxID=568069 RepID=A0A1J1IVT7_9DIPT|nr:CLUMA_CG017420, isoform A [Clunio marinus]
MFERSTRKQYEATLAVNILSLCIGASISWTSPYLSTLQSKNSPFGSPVTSTEASWIGGLLAIGALIGSFFFGWLSEKLGRFWSLMSVAFPQTLWWLSVIFSPTINFLFLGRFLAGFSSGGCFVLVPLYVSEISQDHVRGSLGSFFLLSTNFGMLIIYLCGLVFDYYTTPKVMLGMIFAFVILFSFFNETPIYLLRKGKTEAAVKFLNTLRGINNLETISDEVNIELEKMISKVHNDVISRSDSIMNEFRSSPAAGKGILIGAILMTVNQLSGLFAFLNYTADIFIEAGSSFTPNISAVIVGMLLMLGSLVSLKLVHNYSRKSLYVVTTIGYVFGLLLMGIYSYYKINQDVSDLKFIPVASLSLIIFTASVGRLPLSYIMMAEIIPQNVRSFGISICTTINWIWAFILLRFFSTAVNILSFHNCMFICASFAIFGVFFVIVYVPESKDKSYQEIEDSLNGRIKLSEKHGEDVKIEEEIARL